MKLPISKRLKAIASMVSPGARVADIGCDHGYLGIYLILSCIAKSVIASDLRPMPLKAAQDNAAVYGVSEGMEFICADGLSGVDPTKVDTIICAGMGGEVMRHILEEAPWVRQERYTLILQPQSVQGEFRQWLSEEGFALVSETPVADEGHLYAIMKVRYTGRACVLTNAERLLSQPMRRSASPDLPAYADHVITGLNKRIEGLRCSASPDAQRLRELMQIKDELEHWRCQYELGS